METNISVSELMAIIKASRERTNQDRKFQAAIQGIDIGDDEKEDITSLRDREAEFGIGMGLGYEVEGE